MTDTYNGWANFETWNVKLWMDNDEGTYNMMAEWAGEAWDAADGQRYEWESREPEAQSELAKRIESYVDDQNPLASDANMFSDLLGATLSQVDYREIAGSLLGEVEREAEVTP